MKNLNLANNSKEIFLTPHTDRGHADVTSIREEEDGTIFMVETRQINTPKTREYLIPESLRERVKADPSSIFVLLSEHAAANIKRYDAEFLKAKNAAYDAADIEAEKLGYFQYSWRWYIGHPDNGIGGWLTEQLPFYQFTFPSIDDWARENCNPLLGAPVKVY